MNSNFTLKKGIVNGFFSFLPSEKTLKNKRIPVMNRVIHIFQFPCRKISLIFSRQISAASSVSFESCDRLRKPCGRSSTTVKLTGWPMSRSFLANITESSSKASRAQACVETRTGQETKSSQLAEVSEVNKGKQKKFF